jgi:hypothetical protein
MTINDLIECRDEVGEKFGRSTNVAFTNVSMTQLSIARHYGGAKVQGKHFVYNPDDDSLIREDVVKWFANRKRPPSPQEPKP